MTFFIVGSSKVHDLLELAPQDPDQLAGTWHMTGTIECMCQIPDLQIIIPHPQQPEGVTGPFYRQKPKNNRQARFRVQVCGSRSQ